MKKETGTFDLASIDTRLACNNSVEVEIKHPVTREGTGVFLRILGSDSDAYRNFIKKAAEQNRRKEIMAKKRGRDVEEKTVEENEADTIDLIATCITGWRQNDSDSIRLSGQDMPFTRDNLITVLESNIEVRRQVSGAIHNLELFIPG